MFFVLFFGDVRKIGWTAGDVAVVKNAAAGTSAG